MPQGSGRTDAGVHALAQVVTFVTESSPVPTENFLKALERYFARIGSRARRDGDAGGVSCAAFGAGKDLPLSNLSRVRSARHFWRDMCGTILIRWMSKRWRGAAGLVVGENDFTSFAAVDPERGRDGEPVSNVRTIFSSDWELLGEELVYTVRGSGFLHHMVRNLVGTFILVGRGTLGSKR